jgi:hypothetical protein
MIYAITQKVTDYYFNLRNMLWITALIIVWGLLSWGLASDFHEVQTHDVVWSGSCEYLGRGVDLGEETGTPQPFVLYDCNGFDHKLYTAKAIAASTWGLTMTAEMYEYEYGDPPITWEFHVEGLDKLVDQGKIILE